MSAKTKTDVKNRFVIIMAGGRGERFWPVSREKMPKQLLALLGKKSFLQETVDRVLPLVPVKNIFISPTKSNCRKFANSFPKFPKPILLPSRSTAIPAQRLHWARRWWARVRRPASCHFTRRPRHSRGETISAGFE